MNRSATGARVATCHTLLCGPKSRTSSPSAMNVAHGDGSSSIRPAGACAIRILKGAGIVSLPPAPSRKRVAGVQSGQTLPLLV